MIQYVQKVEDFFILFVDIYSIIYNKGYPKMYYSVLKVYHYRDILYFFLVIVFGRVILSISYTITRKSNAKVCLLKCIIYAYLNNVCSY